MTVTGSNWATTKFFHRWNNNRWAFSSCYHCVANKNVQQISEYGGILCIVSMLSNSIIISWYTVYVCVLSDRVYRSTSGSWCRADIIVGAKNNSPIGTLLIIRPARRCRLLDAWKASSLMQRGTSTSPSANITACPPFVCLSGGYIISPCGFHLTSISRIARCGCCSCQRAPWCREMLYRLSFFIILSEPGIVFRATCCCLHYRSATANLMENAGNVSLSPSAI